MHKHLRVVCAVLIASIPLQPVKAKTHPEITPPKHEPPSIVVAHFIPPPPTPPPTPVPTPVATPKILPKPAVSAHNTPQTTQKKESPDTTSIKQLAQEITDETFGDDQYQYVADIITVESGWRIDAREPRTGAYGLGQALPAIKMAAYGPDYLTNPRTQLLWLMGYIKARYGTPYQAWIFHLAHHWY